MSSDELFTIKEVATVLRLADKTVYSMAPRSELPAFKFRGQWRIRGVEFDAEVKEKSYRAQRRRSRRR